MRALVKERPEPGLSLLEVEVPRVQHADDVQFRVECCAICVGELKVYEWSEWAAADKTLELPTVLGHECAGVVTEVGGAVRDLRPGDLVVPDPFIYCGACYQCRSGHHNMCVSREIYGKRRGAFAEYAVLPERSLARVPDGLSPEEAALLENLGVAMHAVEQEPHDPGDVAVVVGCGPIGILAAQALVAQGVNVILTDMVDFRLEMAGRISGGTVIDVRREDPLERIEALTAGKRADFVIEAAATQSALDQAFDLVRDRGTVVTIGTFSAPVTFNPFFRMTRREIRLVSSIGRTWETWRRMVQLVRAGKVNLRPLVSHVLPMERYQQGFELARSREVMKVLLKP
ncbi:MAG: alcohol dehydrogenase catalytic domain-containing protein [Anaerolineae bacterium]|nr:alcohol dehydrogenase catalytic domain-containing protein [Anaerolineae bacterium]